MGKAFRIDREKLRYIEVITIRSALCKLNDLDRPSPSLAQLSKLEIISCFFKIGSRKVKVKVAQGRI